jgi:hypothetical protein
MTIPGMNPAKRRYVFRFLSTMGAYVVVLIAVITYLVRFHPTGWIVYVLAILPALPIIGIIVAVGLFLAEQKDEFQRRMLEWALLWGMGGTLATTSVWGFLEMFSHAPHITPFYVFPLFWIFVGIAGVALRLSYRGGNE